MILQIFPTTLQPHYDTCFCELCGNDADYGYDCPLHVLFVYDQDPSYNQDFDNFPQTSPNFQQQYLCYENCRGPHETFQCQPLNQNFYEPNHWYNSNSFSFDQFQLPQFPVIHQPPQATSTEMLQARENLMNTIKAFLKENDHIPPKEKCMALALAEERFLKLKQILEEGLNHPEKIQELMLKLLNDLKILNGIQLKKEEQAAKICTPYWKCLIFDDDDDEEYTIQVREYYKNSPVAITPDFSITDSLIMEDVHLDTISETESNKEYESSVEDLNLTPSESEDLSEDLSDIESECDVPVCDDFMTSSNPLFDSYDDSTSSDDESFSDEDVPKENFKIYSKPLFDEEIISTKIDPYHFNAESNLIESLLKRDTSIISSPKFDSLLEEFSDELAHIDLISTDIDEADFDPEEEIRDILEELLNNDSLSLPENESFHFDRYYDPSSPRPLAKPLDDDGIYFDAKPDTGILIVKVVDDISEHYVFKPRILTSQPTLSPHLLSHRGFKAFQLISDFSESSVMIYGGNIPILDVPFLHFYPP
ncbi:hypothetical protein Tco_0890686 [Tanacetum coccineum]|uniref:Uncharacterized protein n=1 Tax=Tanacetum coccineum TaxID=301880 RepID=A0ABQ5C2M3_9ASTR